MKATQKLRVMIAGFEVLTTYGNLMNPNLRAMALKIEQNKGSTSYATRLRTEQADRSVAVNVQIDLVA